MRFELTTLTLARLCSTPELRPLTNREAIYSAGFAGCKREMILKGKKMLKEDVACFGDGDEVDIHHVREMPHPRVLGFIAGWPWSLGDQADIEQGKLDVLRLGRSRHRAKQMSDQIQQCHWPPHSERSTRSAPATGVPFHSCP